jgi:phosphoribosylanthranilate isomerase
MTVETHRAQVKICGISDAHHALVALDAGADMIGLAFAKSPRRVTIDQATEIVSILRKADPDHRVKVVGLFVNDTAEDINHIAKAVGLDRIQLSGDEPAQIVFKIKYPTIGSIRVRRGDLQSAARRLQDWVLVSPWAVITDAHVPGIYGGTGEVGDWDIAAQVAGRYRMFLAGGLTPANVANAIQKVRPFAVDVSTGVETAGKKDEAKIREFVKSAREVQFELSPGSYIRTMGQQT